SVGAADVSVSPGNPRNGHVAPFSSTGNPNYRNLPFESPTLVAPGSEVPLEFQVSVFGRQRTQNTVDGTSVAAPFVGATVGLMLTQNPDLTFEQVRDILRRNSQPLPIASLVERAVGMMGHNSPLGALVQEATLLNANAPQRAQGAGLLNVAGAVEDARRSTRNRPPAGPR
ncbi:MAG: S8 family peptidase, partial [Cyanobacteria bacterium]|nr:S8 family peptidase [Cyanobacteriota bacterium]